MRKEHLLFLHIERELQLTPFTRTETNQQSAKRDR